MGRGTKHIFPKKINVVSQQVHAKMLNTNHQWNTTTKSYHLLPVRVAAIKTIISVDEAVEKREPLCTALLVGLQTGAATMENSMEVPRKMKNPGSVFKVNENRTSKRGMYSHVVHIHNGMLFSQEEEGTPAICDDNVRASRYVS